VAREPFTLGGRSFVRLTSTEDLFAEQEDHIQGLLIPAGLDEVKIGAGEDADAFARRLILQCSTAGVTFQLLSALCVPSEVEEWTLQVAAETEAFMRRLRDETDKQCLREMLTGVLLKFFALGISSLYGSLSASESRTEGDPGSSQSSSATAGPTAAGPTSSESSPATTSTAPGGSLADGLSAT